jgi:hypothetical protein
MVLRAVPDIPLASYEIEALPNGFCITPLEGMP